MKPIIIYNKNIQRLIRWLHNYKFKILLITKLERAFTMRNRLFIAFLLIVMFNYLIGCYSSQKVGKEEVFKSDQMITEVVLQNADVIIFDELGGTVHSIGNSLIGISISDGRSNILNFDSISEIRAEITPSVHPDEIGTKVITEVVKTNNRLIKFNARGGWYDDDRKMIIGVGLNNDTISFKSDLIKEIHTEKAKLIPKEDILKTPDLFIAQVLLQNSNLLITFDNAGAKYVNKHTVVSGATIHGDYVKIDSEDILYVKILKTDVPATILTTMGVIVGILAVATLIALATKQSCPFVYSYNSQKYVFDAEPLGGAITRGLQRTDLSKLEHLKEVDGKYKLLVRNEVPETQYLDEMKLVVVDHPEGTEIVTNLAGEFHTISNPQKPILAIDEKGNDLIRFVEKNDYTFWQTKLPVPIYDSLNNLRHKLTFVFPRPQHKKRAKLIINAGTALWGSQMIREMLNLYGDNIDSWYEKVDNLSGEEMEKEQMMQFVVREELYYLKLNVMENDKWNSQGLIFGGGPFIAETKTYDLDLSNVKGDSLFIQFNPPFGFWTLDYIAVEYDDIVVPDYTEITLSQAVDMTDKDILPIISEYNGEYQTMPEVGDYFLLEYDALPVVLDMERTYFLKTTGYYELHLPKDQPMKEELLQRIVSEPGEVVKYAMELYNQWILVQK